jgi:predicted O-methyltransferase YrrM
LNFLSLFKRNILYKFKKKINIDLDGVNKPTLDELFHYYGSDKAKIFKITKSKGHGFSEFYTKHLKHLKYKKIKILEIGSFAGASAAAFVKYFPNSTVYCFDINISKFNFFSKNIKVYGLDINNTKKLKKTLQAFNAGKKTINFDVIIDDGSHYLSDILLSLKTFFKYLKKKGIYVIEDFKHPNYYKYNKNVDDILIDRMLKHLSNRKNFKSKIITNKDQINLINKIKKISIYKGKLKDSDICFIKKI